MRGRRKRYTFVMEFLGGTYVRQGYGESPELALCAWLHNIREEEFEWAARRKEFLAELEGLSATVVEGCENVWCISGSLHDHLFLIHIITTDPGASTARQVAEAIESASDARRWGLGNRW